MSSLCRGDVADIAIVSRDVAAVSPRCRQVSQRRREVSPRCRCGVAGCRGGVAGCRRCRGVLPSVKSLSPTKVTQQSYQKVCFEQFGSGMECRRGVAAMSQGVADVAVVSQQCRDSVARCRSGVARCRSDVAMVSPDVAVVSRWCRKCRAAVTRCRHDNFFKYPHGFGGLSRGPTPPPTLWPSTRR